jgi:hypothetical protein
MEYNKIEISILVSREIEKNRESFNESQNDILERMLQVKEKVTIYGTQKNSQNPDGSITVQKKYKNKLYRAKFKHGQVNYNEAWMSPSNAAMAVTKWNQHKWLEILGIL